MIGLLFASSVLHAEERRPTRGERLALEGRCEVAVPELERELELVPAPESARVAWRLGQCALRAREYARARGALERALAIDPSLAEANLDLARARYHSGDLGGADAALRAGESLSGEALWQLYRGMVDLGRGDAAAAVQALQRAVDINAATFQTRADPQAVEPVASYYLGLALRAAGEEERARERLDAVADGWAGTDWANEANRSLGRAPRRAWLNLGAGMGYNDNVASLGRDAPLPEEFVEEDDFLAVLVANTGAYLGRWGANSAGLLASYRGRIHTDRDDLREFDTHFPTASLWLNRELRGDTAVRFRYDFGYVWFDTDPVLIENGGRLSLIRAWSARSATELHVRAFSEDVRFSFLDRPDGPGIAGAPCAVPLPAPYTSCGPRFLNERSARDLDGYGGGGGISHSIAVPLGSLPIPDPSLSAGYAYTNLETDGREYTHQAHRVFLGLGFVLPWNLGLDLEGSYMRRLFRHATTFPDREDQLRASGSPPRQYFLSDDPRRDDRYSLDARLSIPLTERVSASLLYNFRANSSNAGPFDYEQQAVGLLFNVYFARAL